jgi:hypothetical protein
MGSPSLALAALRCGFANCSYRSTGGAHCRRAPAGRPSVRPTHPLPLSPSCGGGMAWHGMLSPTPPCPTDPPVKLTAQSSALHATVLPGSHAACMVGCCYPFRWTVHYILPSTPALADDMMIPHLRHYGFMIVLASCDRFRTGQLSSAT